MFANNDSVTDFVVLANFFLLNIAFKCSVIVTNMHHQLPITVCTWVGCAGLWSSCSSWEVMPCIHCVSEAIANQTVCTSFDHLWLGCAGLWSTGCTSSWEVMPIM